MHLMAQRKHSLRLGIDWHPRAPVCAPVVKSGRARPSGAPQGSSARWSHWRDALLADLSELLYEISTSVDERLSPPKHGEYVTVQAKDDILFENCFQEKNVEFFKLGSVNKRGVVVIDDLEFNVVSHRKTWFETSFLLDQKQTNIDSRRNGD